MLSSSICPGRIAGERKSRTGPRSTSSPIPMVDYLERSRLFPSLHSVFTPNHPCYPNLYSRSQRNASHFPSVDPSCTAKSIQWTSTLWISSVWLLLPKQSTRSS